MHKINISIVFTVLHFGKFFPDDLMYILFTSPYCFNNSCYFSQSLLSLIPYNQRFQKPILTMTSWSMKYIRSFLGLNDMCTR